MIITPGCRKQTSYYDSHHTKRLRIENLRPSYAIAPEQAMRTHPDIGLMNERQQACIRLAATLRFWLRITRINYPSFALLLNVGS